MFGYFETTLYNNSKQDMRTRTSETLKKGREQIYLCVCISIICLFLKELRETFLRHSSLINWLLLTVQWPFTVNNAYVVCWKHCPMTWLAFDHVYKHVITMIWQHTKKSFFWTAKKAKTESVRGLQTKKRGQTLN